MVYRTDVCTFGVGIHTRMHARTAGCRQPPHDGMWLESDVTIIQVDVNWQGCYY